MGILYTSITTMLVLVLLGAAVHKLRSANRLVSAASRLVGAHSEFERMPSFFAFMVEIAAAIAILYPLTRQLGFAAAAMLWGAYAVLAWRARRRGEVFDCGCRFTLGMPRDDRSPIIRGAILAFFAVGAALLPADPVFELPALLAGMGCFGLLVVSDGIAALPR